MNKILSARDRRLEQKAELVRKGIFNLSKIRCSETEDVVSSKEEQMCQIRNDEFIKAMYAEIIKVEYATRRWAIWRNEIIMVEKSEQVENYLLLLRSIIQNRIAIMYPKLIDTKDALTSLPKVSVNGKGVYEIWHDKRNRENKVI